MGGEDARRPQPGYRNLIAWQKAIDLVERIYRATKDWPREELYGLTSQVRRAAVSVPANIAEGRGRATPKEYAHYLTIAHGSLGEVETHLVIAARLSYIDQRSLESFDAATAEVGRLLNGLIKSTKSGIEEEDSEYDSSSPTPDASI